jgi:hypothetical protein
MALARVVTFEGVTAEHMESLKQRMTENDMPEGVPATEAIVLHDPNSDASLAIVFFETEDDYQRGHEALSAMPTDDTPGRRTSVAKYEVAIRSTA